VRYGGIYRAWSIAAINQCTYSIAVINQCTYSIAVINQCTYSIAVINQCTYSIAVINQCTYSIAVINQCCTWWQILAPAPVIISRCVAAVVLCLVTQVVIQVCIGS
jgi:hypothetical protein